MLGGGNARAENAIAGSDPHRVNEVACKVLSDRSRGSGRRGLGLECGRHSVGFSDW